ncbi:MAG: DUF6164 family protein [Proteobacteria bacterium]|jgi:hypothetical protein|nr:DUF6164 family protein [Pseudomonadota bacterium]
MPVLLLKLRGVPDDEANEIRTVLRENGIKYYETSAGNWGISLPAIWLRDKTQLPEANALLERYEAQRLSNAKQEYVRLKREGNSRSLLDVIQQEPIRVVIYIGIIAVILYFSTVPFLNFAE